ncbi:ubiquinol-cytochrome C reductase [Corynespora cassiicola Philippines]|uniref:Complex III subunit 9 n=1 Tax=Corynespora cassiicola Philippines TaxID=1448308 RepID=A0A2T2NFM9_CORCC|nr:ubiquinol-cytochrome C reductase [Corynespora cassiicola Philippines]
MAVAIIMGAGSLAHLIFLLPSTSPAEHHTSSSSRPTSTTVAMAGVSQLRLPLPSPQSPANADVPRSHPPSTSKSPPTPRLARAPLTSGRSIFLRRNTTMLGTVFAAAFGLQLAFDTGSDKIWDSVNKGRQWKDIKHRYVEKADDDE